VFLWCIGAFKGVYPEKGGAKGEGVVGRGNKQKKPKKIWVIPVNTADKKSSKNNEFRLIINKKCYVCGVNIIKTESK
jgi:hypothetical protein